MIPVKIRVEALSQAHWHEYAIRFVLGGITTVLAGLIAAQRGPAVGGLFLAFPAIFPASATLLEKHQRKKKEKAGFKGARRGQEAAALEAAGAALGSIGLVAFAVVVWLVEPISPRLAIAAAALAWIAVSLLMWLARRKLRIIRVPR